MLRQDNHKNFKNSEKSLFIALQLLGDVFFQFSHRNRYLLALSGADENDDCCIANTKADTQSFRENDYMKSVNILGIRGVPAAHGGFETFAHHLAPYLVEQGWRVNVYCQHERIDNNAPPDGYQDKWRGVGRIHFRVDGDGPLSTIKFDFRCSKDVVRRPGVDLVLGYNTAIFTLIQRLRGRKIAMNMDGVEWRRDKWGMFAKTWFYINEFSGSHLATLPIADHPEIGRHLRRHGCQRAKVIPYASARVASAPTTPIESMGLTPGNYLVSIARIEPENSILEIVRAFTAKPRRAKLVILGKLLPGNAYHQKVRSAGDGAVLFPGAIYDKQTVEALRVHALAYVHGHQVGGTNPSLVEALGCGNAVVAHDNCFNRWVAGEGQYYFRNEAQLGEVFDRLDLNDPFLEEARKLAAQRHAEAFTFDNVHAQYERLLTSLL